MTEHDTQAAFMNYMHFLENEHPELRWIHAVPNGGARDVVTGARMKREGYPGGALRPRGGRKEARRCV